MKALAQAYEAIAHAAGHVLAVPLAAVLLTLLWVFAGTEASNFAISIISLLLLFVLQSSSNRDGLAIQAKLDCLIAASEADNALIKLDEKPEEEVRKVRDAGTLA